MLFDQVTRLAFGLGDRGATAPVEPAELAAPPARKPKVGLALGGGAARGWSHIGVVRALWESGIELDVIAGTSIGAVVGGSAKAGKLDQLEIFARSLTKRRVIGLMDLHIGGSGLIAGDRLRRLLEQDLSETLIEELPGHFGAIATELGTGHEIWLTHGRLVDAVRASYALPGIFDPVKIGGRWLMDGALVNPIPVTAARALGAELVIAVNLNGDIFGRGTVIQNHGTMNHTGDDALDPTATIERGMFDSVRNAASLINPFARRSVDAPRLASVMIDAFNITQDRISRARLAGDPPDVMIAPKLGRMGLFEFHRADECVALGYEAAMRAMPDIVEALTAMVVAPR